MAFKIDEFIRVRPYLYHLTAPENLPHICASRSITPAAKLMRSAGRTDLLRRRRGDHEPIEIGDRRIILRDQAPLYRGNLKLPEGYNFEDFIESLNSRVFFWPGTALGPISYGMRHFERYKGEHPVILRIQFKSLIEANPLLQPLFCRYNSGSPRCSYGEKSPRGPNTFIDGTEFPDSASKVVEVTFDQKILLPPDTDYGAHPQGRWQPLLGC